MNQFDAFPRAITNGYHVMIRLARDGEPKPILTKGGHPQVFRSEAEAWAACTRHLLAYLNFPILGGEIAGGSLEAARVERAERLFRKGKVVEVQRIGTRSEARP